jgi:hypothetical protein
VTPFRLRHKNRVLTYLLALGILLSQCTLVFAEYKHPFHKADAKCPVCLVSDHLSHAAVYVPPALHVDHLVILPATESVVVPTTWFTLRYFIRAPPSL